MLAEPPLIEPVDVIAAKLPVTMTDRDDLQAATRAGASRQRADLEVTLLWDAADNSTSIEVWHPASTETLLRFDVPGEDALDAFYHPFAHLRASDRSVTEPFAVEGLFETHLTVSDLDRSIAFYRDVVGLPLALELPERGAAFFWIGQAGKAMLGLWTIGSAPVGLSLPRRIHDLTRDVLAASDRLERSA